jgi:hypothetical protein
VEQEYHEEKGASAATGASRPAAAAGTGRDAPVLPRHLVVKDDDDDLDADKALTGS